MSKYWLLLLMAGQKVEVRLALDFIKRESI